MDSHNDNLNEKHTEVLNKNFNDKIEDNSLEETKEELKFLFKVFYKILALICIAIVIFDFVVIFPEIEISDTIKLNYIVFGYIIPFIISVDFILRLLKDKINYE